MKVPKTKKETEDLRASLQKTLSELEADNENPNVIFRKNMEEGYLYNAAFKDASNALQVYAGIYQSIKELEEILEKKEWD